MKQLDLFSVTPKNQLQNDFSLINNNIQPSKKKFVCEPVLKPQEVSFIKGQYVRTRQGEIYFIDGLMPSQKVFAGYKTFKDRYGNPYQKTVYANRERAYAYVMKNGKQVKTIICQEDAVLQSPFIIDLVFKGDCVYTVDNGNQYIEHKQIGKIINKEVFTWDKTIQNTKKSVIPYPKTYVVCNNNKLILHESDITGLVSEKLDYSRYLEQGSQVFSDYWGWCIVDKIMSGKVLCSCSRSNRPVFIYFDQIKAIKE
ncbi:hypothetical protein MKC79_09795 [[Clostridium] innocuum]|nr:hypothetical protein [[Clostridium] innocuum]